MLAKVLVALALVLGLSNAAEVLTDATFDSAIGKDSAYFVKFYAPWCGHCKRLAPTWDKLAEEAAAAGLNVKVAKVDCTTERDVCTKQAIRGYPTLQLFEAGSTEPVKYNGGRDLPALLAFAKEHQPRA